MRRINSNIVQLNAIEAHLMDLFEAELADGHNIVEASLRALRTTTGRVASSEFARHLSDDTVTMVYGRPELTKKGKDILKAEASKDENNNETPR